MIRQQLITTSPLGNSHSQQETGSENSAQEGGWMEATVLLPLVVGAFQWPIFFHPECIILSIDAHHSTLPADLLQHLPHPLSTIISGECCRPSFPNVQP